MRYGDLLAKLASGQQLTPGEVEALRLQGNRQDDAASQMAGWSAGSGDISVGTVRGRDGFFQIPPTGHVSVNTTSSASFSSGTQAPVTFGNQGGRGRSDAAFTWSSTVNPDRVQFVGSPAQETFLISGSVVWKTNSSGSRTAVLAYYDSSAVSQGGVTLAQVAPVSGKETVMPFITTIRWLTNYNYCRLELLQDGVASLYIDSAWLSAMRV